jgi:hypothetical protein
LFYFDQQSKQCFEGGRVAIILRRGKEADRGVVVDLATRKQGRKGLEADWEEAKGGNEAIYYVE